MEGLCEYSEFGGMRHQVQGQARILGFRWGMEGSGGKRGSPRGLQLLLVIVGVTGEARLLWGPGSLREKSGSHFPLFLKTAGARDLQTAAAVAGFLPAQLVWLVGIPRAPEEIGVLILLGAASPVRAGRRRRRGLPQGRLGGRLRSNRGFLAFLPAVG